MMNLIENLKYHLGLGELYVGSSGFSRTSKSQADWKERQRFEHLHLREFIENLIGPVPHGSILLWKESDHEMGTYCDFRFIYHLEDEAAAAYGSSLELLDLESLKGALEDLWPHRDKLQTIETQKS